MRAKEIWRRARRWIEDWGPRFTDDPWAALVFAVPALCGFAYAVAIVAVRVWHECLLPYNVDSPIYWTIGHGILKGYAPYRDLWDIKPPGIFLLSALSYLVTRGPFLTHVTQILSFVLVALSPLASLRAIQSRTQAIRVAPVVLSLWTVFLMLTAFTADSAGMVQTESHALVAMVGYMLLVGVPGGRAFGLRAVAIGVAMGLKEPFLLAVIASYLTIDPETKRPWEDFWGPLLLASVVGALFLLVVGWLPAFIGLYLHSMVGSGVTIFGSPYIRILGTLDLSWETFRKYSLFLPITLTYCFGIYLFSAKTGTDPAARDSLSRRFQVLMLGLLTSFLAVGMTGYYYPHHFVLMVPIFFAVLFTLMTDVVRTAVSKPAAASPLLRAAVVPLALLVVLVPDWVPPATYRENARNIHEADVKAREAAEVIDAVLDRLHIDRFQWIGPGGFPPWTYTRHIPLGPMFFQQIIFFDGHYPQFLTRAFRKQLAEAQVIVFDQHIAGPMDGEVKATLKNFDPVPAKLIPPGKSPQWRILIRKGIPIP